MAHSVWYKASSLVKENQYVPWHSEIPSKDGYILWVCCCVSDKAMLMMLHLWRVLVINTQAITAYHRISWHALQMSAGRTNVFSTNPSSSYSEKGLTALLFSQVSFVVCYGSCFKRWLCLVAHTFLFMVSVLYFFVNPRKKFMASGKVFLQFLPGIIAFWAPSILYTSSPACLSLPVLLAQAATKLISKSALNCWA